MPNSLWILPRSYHGRLNVYFDFKYCIALLKGLPQRGSSIQLNSRL